MKEQITKINFICDNCKTRKENQEKFPYSDGWIFLYNLNMQLEKEDKIRRIDRRENHFCSEKCVSAFIKKEINATKGQIITEEKL